MSTRHCKLFRVYQRVENGQKEQINCFALVMGKKGHGAIRALEEGETLEEAKEKALAIAKRDRLIVSWLKDDGQRDVFDYSGNQEKTLDRENNE